MIKELFTEAIINYSGNEALAIDLWNDIQKKYSRSGRHYHTLMHIETVSMELIPYRDQFKNWHSIVFAIVYHDIVYNPLKSNNEERSALYAREKLKSTFYPKEDLVWCESLILATKRHLLSEENEINLFTDADLSILGTEPGDYARYLKQIRAEYFMYPDFLYVPGRKKVLKHFLEMNRIFKTREFYNKYELKARANIGHELKSLTE